MSEFCIRPFGFCGMGGRLGDGLDQAMVPTLRGEDLARHKSLSGSQWLWIGIAPLAWLAHGLIDPPACVTCTTRRARPRP